MFFLSSCVRCIGILNDIRLVSYSLTPIVDNQVDDQKETGL